MIDAAKKDELLDLMKFYLGDADILPVERFMEILNDVLEEI